MNHVDEFESTGTSPPRAVIRLRGLGAVCRTDGRLYSTIPGVCGRGHPRSAANVNVDGHCRACLREKDRARRRTPEGQRAQGVLQRRKRYGIEPADFDTLVLAAQGRCTICGLRDENTPDTGLVLDHEHAAGRARDLICGTCNTALGYVERGDINPAWLECARQYLERHRQEVSHPTR